MKKDKVKITLAIFLAFVSVLCAGLGTAFALTYSRYQTYKNKSVTVSAKINQMNDDAARIGPTVPVSYIEKYASQTNFLMEFLQRIFPDKVVYKGEFGIVYDDLDPDLQKHKYDYECMQADAKGIKQYDDGGIKGIKGVDVSYYNTNINWKKVKADGVSFAIVRAGYRGYVNGAVVKDTSFDSHMSGALAEGIKTGVYFYSQAVNVKEAVEEAEFVLAAIKNYDVTYPVVFDMEEVTGDNVRTGNLTAEQRTDIAVAFCERIEQAGFKPMVYGNIKWMIEKLDLSRLEAYDKWFAQYNYTAPTYPYQYQMWQYTETGDIDGISGKADINISFVDYAKQK